MKSTGSVETRIVDVGRDLASAFAGVLESIPGGPHRPQLLARSLRLNVVLTSRILKAARQRDPLAVAHVIPGPEPLRRLLRAAERKGVDARVIGAARAAVDRFEQLIDREAGDRSALDAIISGWLPDAREKVELIAKQSVYRGVSQLLGTACDVEHCTIMLYPSAEVRGRADAIVLTATLGLRRVRPGYAIRYDSVHADTTMLTLTGKPVEEVNDLLLERFCSKPVPRLEVSHFGDGAQYTLSGDSVGVKSAVSLVHATYFPGRRSLHQSPGGGGRTAPLAIGISIPSKTFLFDVLIHEDVYPGRDPTLSLYRTVGVFAPRSAERDIDRLDVIESIQTLGRGIGKFRAADTPRFQDMVRHACDCRGWDGEKLRGYRCRIEYPMYSAEVVMEFEVPPEP